MKSFLLCLCFLSACGVAFSQTYKNQWLVGGNGTFSYKISPDNFFYKIKSTTLAVNPDAGFFILTNLAVGARTGYSYTGHKRIDNDSLTSNYNNHQLSAAPFVRYYFLKPAHRVNILADAVYNWYLFTEKTTGFTDKRTTKGYAFAAGPAFFISPASALEITVGYAHTNNFYENSDISINIGFHQHWVIDHKRKNPTNRNQI